jgi:hypothetical protein
MNDGELGIDLKIYFFVLAFECVFASVSTTIDGWSRRPAIRGLGLGPAKRPDSTDGDTPCPKLNSIEPFYLTAGDFVRPTDWLRWTAILGNPLGRKK